MSVSFGHLLVTIGGRQHVGKTTASLGIISGLQKRFDNVGFIKPVGQQHERTKEGILVDKVKKACDQLLEK